MLAHVLEMAGTGEVLTELVEGDGHHAVGGVESLLDAVAVVDVDVDIQHALMHLEQLEDGEDDVVHVAETGGFVLLGVVQSAGPVYHRVRLLVVETNGAADRAARVDLAKVEQTVKDGAILRAVEALQLAHVLVLVVGGDETEELDVLVAVELGHVLRRGERGAEELRTEMRGRRGWSDLRQRAAREEARRAGRGDRARRTPRGRSRGVGEGVGSKRGRRGTPARRAEPGRSSMEKRARDGRVELVDLRVIARTSISL